MIDWNIQTRAHACQACHRHFEDKESVHTLLYDQKQAYERLDVCDGCWARQFSEGGTDRKGFVSHWASVYSVPPAAPPDPIGKETAESLLRKLVEENHPTHAGARFILAVMLERKRLLKVKAQLNEGGRRIFVYEHGKSGDLFNIPDPDLRLDQLVEVQRDVADLLENGLTVTPNGATASAATSLSTGQTGSLMPDAGTASDTEKPSSDRPPSDANVVAEPPVVPASS